MKLSVVNEVGKEAIVAILGPADFFGEGCLAGQTVRMGTATALIPTTVSVIQKNEMMRAIHSERKFPDRFMSYLLSRKLRTEEDLIDHLFNSSEKRLARALLLLTGYGKQEPPQKMLPKDVTGNAGGNGWHNALPGQLFHDQIQKKGLYQVQRRTPRQAFTPKCTSARVSAKSSVAPPRISGGMGNGLMVNRECRFPTGR